MRSIRAFALSVATLASLAFMATAQASEPIFEPAVQCDVADGLALDLMSCTAFDVVQDIEPEMLTVRPIVTRTAVIAAVPGRATTPPVPIPSLVPV